jgi:Short C-terminal domain
MFKRRQQPTEMSPEEHLRVDAAVADLSAVDPKARGDLEPYLRSLEGLWQLLAPSEEISWLQNVMACTGPDGQIDVYTFCHGVLALTDQHLVFTGSRPDGGTRNGSWALTELATVDLVHDRALGEVLLIGSRSSQMGFCTKKRKAASQELLSRVRTAITRAREVPSKPQASGSIADELAKWAKLRDDGAISEDEFAVVKAKLLGH